MLKGKRTYLVGFGMIAYAVLGLVLGLSTQEQAVQLIGTGLGFIFLRKAL